jgi:hypothetical protein
VIGQASSNALERISRFAEHSAAVATLGGWALTEAIVLPIVPDVGLGLLALAAPSRALRLFAAVIVGALAGTLVLAAIWTQAPEAARALLLSIPGIHPDTLTRVDRVLARDGVGGFAQFGPGAPLKVYTVEWLARGGDIAGVLVGAVLNRITRIGPPLVAAMAIGYFAGPVLRRHPGAVLAGYAAFWLLVYIAYFGGLF